MRNIKLTIEYDGKDYCGWQVQPNGRTVQAEVCRAVKKMVGHDVVIIGSGRTDSGVHALAQVANFATTSKISCDGFLKGINSILRGDVSIRSVEDVPPDFHAKRSARSKHYRYLIYTGRSKPALLRDRVWHLKTNLKPAKIVSIFKKAAKPLVGEHDFSSFCAVDDGNHSKVRKILKMEARSRKHEAGGDVIEINIVGTGFLKHMVRNIVGTLVMALKCKGGDHAKFIKNILDSKDRKKAGVNAPACGLYLVKVKY